MFRPCSFSYRLRFPLAKAQDARSLTVVKPDSPLGRKISLKTEKIVHTKTFEPLFNILHSRPTFVSLWRSSDDYCGDRALPASDGLLYPGRKWVQYRKWRKTYSTPVNNGLRLDVKDESLLSIIDMYVGSRGDYVLGREDDSPTQPHMWEIPKDTTIPPSLRLTTYRRKSLPEHFMNIVLGPAFPMPLDCLNRHLEQFTQDCCRVTPLRHWFTPEEEFCKMYPQAIDFIRLEERWRKSNKLDDDT